MHVNNYTLPTPPQELLNQCTKVVVVGPDSYSKIRHWCWGNQLSLVWSDIVLADHKQLEDLAEFYFSDPADATLFRLKWK